MEKKKGRKIEREIKKRREKKKEEEKEREGREAEKEEDEEKKGEEFIINFNKTRKMLKISVGRLSLF
jgi:hypothetical protein